MHSKIVFFKKPYILRYLKRYICNNGKTGFTRFINNPKCIRKWILFDPDSIVNITGHC